MGQFLWRQSRRVDFNLHFEGTLGSKVRLKHLLEAFSGVDVDAESGSLADDVSLSVNELE